MDSQWFSQWEHVFKLDPDREISEEHLELICMSGTDAIIVGGSSGVTYENTVDLLSRIRRYSLDCVLEVSTMDGAVPGFDGYFVPFVLNTKQADYLMLNQLEGLQTYGHFVPWHMTAASGYIVLNEDCTAAKVSGAEASLSTQEVLPYVWMADRLLHLPLLYIEYSGAFGDMSLLRRIASEVEGARLFYGGGIDGAELASEAAQYAHTVVVGNVVYNNIEAALETVQAVKSIKSMQLI
ncbi:heptaprenylglyceryl phosphate synthase [Paenibacillus endoradicis]|uniref:heptaprenylglyceryl phosphate synthase n=1 Tax=Paenibacillus endoradicis TaxID=2972487 RepID=UPI002158B539|nr:heptaprenylglyceryl phosphate synthase [Paenibacillus endoradicis]MCR8660576.1 heptaprenylglyceryl phosphate synthase [Paenibacillus endoradicis]